MQSLRCRPLLVWTAALACLITQPARADVKAGVDAWQAKKYDAAVKEWRPLAEKGDPDAQFNMGQAYMLGRGVSHDVRVAQSWYEKAAQQGHEPAQANLGLLLFQGGQRKEAMPWIRKAAEYGDPRAQYIMGTALYNGDLAPQDLPRAYAFMTRAKAQGLSAASTSLAEMDKYIPAAERQAGLALAQDMERSLHAASALPPSVIKPASPGPASAPATAPLVAKAAPTKKPAPGTTPRASATPAVVATASPRPAGKWRVQLGAYGSAEAAQGQWSTLSKRLSALAGLQPHYEKAGALTRLRAGPLANRAVADRICAAAIAGGQPCFPVAP